GCSVPSKHHSTKDSEPFSYFQEAILSKFRININTYIECTCGHKWGNDDNGLWLIFNGADQGYYL
ncbi:hypothetical protein ACTNDP_22925, partial [Paenibacillus barengoltzii]|uniref:hypothetical protein n=1 Tax=Paenibacillus barengoltzii TaxID=343517 RepID=UPI003F8ABA86